MIIINADDFGLSKSVNKAITDAFESGLISNTTMLANGGYFDEAVKLADEHNFSDKVGIHFNLTEGVPLTDDIKDCPAFCENGIYHRVHRLKQLSKAEKAAVYKELSAQAEKIKKAGFEIDHADSHHHIHTAIFIAPIVFRVCKETGINKIRLHRNIGEIQTYKKPIKNIYNKNLRKKGFKTTLHFGSLKDIVDDELTPDLEIMVHPDYDKDGVLIDRRGMEGDFPTGVRLYSVADKYNVQLKSYGDL